MKPEIFHLVHLGQFHTIDDKWLVLSAVLQDNLSCALSNIINGNFPVVGPANIRIKLVLKS